jgi:hypothetical protein
MASSLASPIDTRPSRRDRERVADALRRACVDERLSSETFIGRLDLVYAARTRFELDRLVADLPGRSAPRTLLLNAVAWGSALSTDLWRAWQGPRFPRMILPQRAEVMIGRSPLADFVVADQTVSSRHALLKHDGTTWMIHDAGSTNGTFLNGWRITDPMVVRPGDELTVGESTYVLVLAPA